MHTHPDQKYSTNILGRRLLIRTIAALLMILIGAVFVDLWFAGGRNAEESREDLVRRINSIEPYIIQALWRVDSESVRVAIQSIAASPGVAQASLRAQFRINDINESFVREPDKEATCSAEIIRDYSSTVYSGMEIGSGVLKVCFSDALIRADAGSFSFGDGLLKNFAVATVMAAVFFVLIKRSTIQPVNQIIARVRDRKLLSGEPLRRDVWDHHDELDELFSQLIKKEQKVDSLHRDDKLRILGVLASGVAHDFNNVLAVIMGHAELLMLDEDTTSATFKKRLNTLTHAVRTGAAMTRRLQLLSGKAPEQFKKIHLNEIMQNVEFFVELLVNSPKTSVRVRFEINTNQMILVDPGGLEAALLNLVLNARDAVQGKEDAEISVIISNISTGTTKEIKICVSDNGDGIAPDVIEHVTEPFFTTKKKTGGSGLGLAMVNGFVERCGGRLEIESKPDKGTSVSIVFPIVVGSGDTDDIKPPEHAPLEIDRSATRILVIDDEKPLAKSLSLLLKRLGYQCEFTTDAIQVMNDATTLSAYDLIISDVLLGPITGPELYNHFESVLGGQCPPVIFISGAVPDSFSEAVRKRIENDVIYKPFDISTLDQRILSAIRPANQHQKAESLCEDTA